MPRDAEIFDKLLPKIEGKQIVWIMGKYANMLFSNINNDHLFNLITEPNLKYSPMLIKYSNIETN